MDKRRIETAAWNEYILVLTLRYSVFKNEAGENVQKKIASAGNDTEKYISDDAVYNKLPDCCHYQRKLP